LFEDDTFRFEVNVINQAQQQIVQRSVLFDLKSDKLDMPTDPLYFNMRFEPLKPFKA